MELTGNNGCEQEEWRTFSSCPGDWPSLGSPSLPSPSMKAQAAEGTQSHHLRPMKGGSEGFR